MPGPVQEMRLALTVKDFDAAVSFYRDVLGLPQEACWVSQHGRVVLLEVGRATLEISDEGNAAFIDEIEVGSRTAGAVRIALNVSDTRTTAARLVDGGAEILGPPQKTPFGSVNARLRGPEGMQLTLFELLDGEEQWKAP